jgi:hypothetical protein
MGRAPDQHIMKKLIRKYFKFDLNRSNFNTASSYYTSLLNTWAKKGMDSPEAEFIQSKIDLAMQNDDKEFREIKKLTKQLPYDLNQMLPKIKTKYAFKGRDKQVQPTYNRTTEKDIKEYNKMAGIKEIRH